MKTIQIFSQNEVLTNALQEILASYRIASDSMHPLQRLLPESSLVLIDAQDLKHTHNVVLECRHRQVPCFLFWSNESQDLRNQAFESGFSDFLMPPFFPSVVASKVKTHINIAEMVRSYTSKVAAPSHCNDSLDHELLAVQDAAILCLAAVARVRDHSTGNHILRTQHYVKALAEHLRFHPDYRTELDDDETIELFYKTASLHDIGKVGIPDAILQKPGKLDAQEYEEMKKHTIYGYQAIHSAELLLERETKGKASKFLKIAQEVTLSHHERWDGQGYPQGLKGDEIPVVARLMSVADVYDAVISRRPYKDAIEHTSACDIILQGRGTLFDPAVVDAFEDLQETFDKISYILEDYFPSQSDLTLHGLDDLIYK